MKRFAGIFLLACAVNGTLAITDAAAQINRSQGSSAVTGEWFNTASWSLGHWPVAGEDVVVTNHLILSNATELLQSCLITNATLVFTNWNTKLWVAGAVTVTGASARLTLPAAFTNGGVSNRVHVQCGSFTLAAGAVVDVSEKGYAGGSGPGNGFGASYGDSRPGYNPQPTWGASGTNYFGPAYGSLIAPVDPGSGGNGQAAATTGGNGGGAVWIDATGTVFVAGSILANGQIGPAKGDIHAGGGSGGGIYITCSQLAGASIGLLSAKGGGVQSWGGWSGSGGRIAVVYDPTAQAGVNPGVRFAAAGGDASGSYIPFRQGNYQGTLYCSDGAFLSPNMGGGQFSNVTFYANNFTNWAPASLTISNNTAIDFGYDGFRLAVAGDLTLGDYGTLGLRSNANVTVGGNMTMRSNSKLYIRSGATNGIATDYGALLAVAGDLTIGSNSWIYPISHYANGGSPLLRMRNLVVNKDGGIDANGWGYGPTRGPGNGYAFCGAGYGGQGGIGGWGGPQGATYGNTNVPGDPGSGSRYNTPAMQGNEGGGYIRIEAGQDVTMNGKLMANGVSGGGVHYGGGSGGGIFVQCRKFNGATNGLVKADGGNGTTNFYGGGGGGGRIAIWYGNSVSTSLWSKILVGAPATSLTYTNFSGLPSYLGSNSVAGGYPGQTNLGWGSNGTAVVIQYDLRIGTIFSAF